MGGAVRRSEQDVRGSRDRIRALNFRVAGLFTRVRGKGILRTSPFGHSRKLRFTEFHEVRRFLGALMCLCHGAHTLTSLRSTLSSLRAPAEAARRRRTATCPPPRPGPATRSTYSSKGRNSSPAEQTLGKTPK